MDSVISPTAVLFRGSRDNPWVRVPGPAPNDPAEKSPEAGTEFAERWTMSGPVNFTTQTRSSLVTPKPNNGGDRAAWKG